MSRQGGDNNHFIGARERDLRPLLEEAVRELALDADQLGTLEAFLGEAWVAGTRSGHAKLMRHALRCRLEPSRAKHGPVPVDAEQMEAIETELRALMDASAAALALPAPATLHLWDAISRAWIAGVSTYETEVMASLLERRSGDVAAEALRWLEDNGQDGPPSDAS